MFTIIYLPFGGLIFALRSHGFERLLLDLSSVLLLLLLFGSRVVYAWGNPGNKCDACGRYK